eukprot:3923103-Pyramimonas_sp.AAC.1
MSMCSGAKNEGYHLNGGDPEKGYNNWPLRGGKGGNYEGGVRSTAFIHSVVWRGSRCTRTVICTHRRCGPVRGSHGSW